MPRRTPATRSRRPSGTSDAPSPGTEPATDAPRAPVLIDLALQGGGSHGAFTWGVLDRLLEENWLRIDGVSGTSAGAMNAAVMADGYAAGGAPARARRSTPIGGLWPRRRASARSSAARSTCCFGRWTLDHSPMFVAMDLMSRLYLALRPQPRRHQSAARRSSRRRSTSSG